MTYAAVCRWPGTGGLRAEFVRVRDDGSYLMRAIDTGPRVASGATFAARPDEIMEWTGGFVPPEIAAP